MRKTTRTLIPVSLALALAAAAHAQTRLELLPPADTDLTAATIVAAPPVKTLAVPREPVALGWPLDPNAALAATPEPFLATSREYFVDVTADELRAGVPVYATAPGALVRLNPAAPATPELGARLAIEPVALVLTDPAGAVHRAGGGMELVARAPELEASSAPFAPGTSAFRLRSDLGAGTFELRAETLPRGAERYVIHVLDRESPARLELRTGATDYLHGDELVVEARLAAGGRALDARSVEGFVTSPQGRAWPLDFRARGGVYRATLTLDAVEPPAPGPWQVHVSAHGRLGDAVVLRAGRTAFGCAVPAARLTGAAERAGETLRLEIEAASAGRYEVRGVLYGTDRDGAPRPAGVAHAAAWLEPGTSSLELGFDVGASALAPPWELRDLRLLDQGRMGLLHRQARALVLER